jgi:putative phage-type endonuclease
MKQVFIPKNQEEWLKLRLRDVTSTEVSALFGLSPWTTVFEVWHQKKNQEIVDFHKNERMSWGTRLQDAIAHGVAEDDGLKIRRMDEYIRQEDKFMGASFDFEILDDEGILEVKNVDSFIFKDGWIVDGDNIEAPPHYELQVQHQLAVSEKKYAVIAALVGGNRIVKIRRERDEKVISAIETKVKEFMYSLIEDREPKPDFVRDAEFISRLYGFAEPGKILNAEGDIEIATAAHEYRSLGEEIKFLEGRRAEMKSKMLMKIGSAEKVLGAGFSISAGVVEGGRVEAFDRKGYRGFRVNFVKEKK